ncbi:flavodoxin family protein [Methanobrevibacter ruminantium]|uniref:flavodoxin family protein n=1 Tax=Methanobrevibacter ruminantium TaxID=83816 RepID=UPI0026EAF4E2|nr:flavodoxin family protein [Methanobrevibacter ruminantium]
MDIVAIMGSPRKHGNTDMLLDEMIKGAEEKGHNVKKYYISDLEVHPCRACGVCMQGKDCVRDDGLTVTHEIAKADGLIVSSPIYFGQMTGALKVLIDRFYGITHNPLIPLSGKVVLIFTHLGPEGYYDSYIELSKIQHFMMNMGYEVMDVLDVGSLGDVRTQPKN